MFRTALIALGLALTSLGSIAQVSATIGDRATALPPADLMPPSKIYIDSKTIPGRRIGVKTPRVRVSSEDVNFVEGVDPYNQGQFRINCSFSHAAFDDPIVQPGRPGFTHLHQFFGNTKTAAATDLINMGTSGDSTCLGGTLNRTGYWVPTLVYHRPGHPNNGKVYVSTSALFYYKGNGGSSTDPTVWPPVGFRMIAGNPSATTPLSSSVGTIACLRGGAQKEKYNHIPTTAEATPFGGCDGLEFIIAFPACWNGTDIDSPSHGIPNGTYSHVRKEDYYTGCTTYTTPTNYYPVLFPVISLNIKHTGFTTADLDYIRLSSDPPSSSGQPGGWTLHSDWVNGWSEEPNFMGTGKTLTQLILDNCLSRGQPGPPYNGSDCHANNVPLYYGVNPPQRLD